MSMAMAALREEVGLGGAPKVLLELKDLILQDKLKPLVTSAFTTNRTEAET